MFGSPRMYIQRNNSKSLDSSSYPIVGYLSNSFTENDCKRKFSQTFSDSPRKANKIICRDSNRFNEKRNSPTLQNTNTQKSKSVGNEVLSFDTEWHNEIKNNILKIDAKCPYPIGFESHVSTPRKKYFSCSFIEGKTYNEWLNYMDEIVQEKLKSKKLNENDETKQ